MIELKENKEYEQTSYVFLEDDGGFINLKIEDESGKFFQTICSLDKRFGHLIVNSIDMVKANKLNLRIDENQRIKIFNNN